MQDDLILVRCADTFAHRIDELFLEDRIEIHNGPGRIEEPTIGMFHLVGDEIAAAALAELSRRASAARKWFAIDGPWWAQPLPTTGRQVTQLAWIGELIEAGTLPQDYFNGRMLLFSNFAVSQCCSKWVPTHPSFDRFARAKMADCNTPRWLRDNLQLRREYPPQRLVTLMPGIMAAALDHSEARVAEKARLRESGS